MKTIQIECPSCNGTGLYAGMAERDGAAVVCRTCGGSGETSCSYNEFTGRKIKMNVKRVYQGSYGHVISANDAVTKDGEAIKFSQYGCTYEEWLNGAVPEHIKDLYCPYIAYNGGNEPLEQCKQGGIGWRFISNCAFYDDKMKCWDMFDSNPK